MGGVCADLTSAIYVAEVRDFIHVDPDAVDRHCGVEGRQLLRPVLLLYGCDDSIEWP